MAEESFVGAKGMSILRKVHLSNTKVCMIMLLILFIALIVRVYPFLPYALVPGEDDANHIYPVFHIINTGHELVPGEIKTYGYTNGIYVAINDRSKNMLPAMSAIISGLDENQYFIFERFFLFISVVVFPFSILMLYSYLCRKNGRQRSNHELVLLFAAATIANYLLINVTSYQSQANINSAEWTFFILAFYSLLRSKENFYFGALFVLLTISITLLHRTSAMFFLCVIVMMLLWRLFLQVRRKCDVSHLYSSGILIIGIIVILVYYLYIGTNFFDTASSMAANITTILGEHGPAMLYQYFGKSTLSTQIFMVADIIASALSLFYFLIYLIRKKYDYIGGYQLSMAWLPWLLALIPFSVGVFTWAGLYGVFGRTNLYAIVVYLIALVIILSSPIRNSSGLKWVKIFLIIAILLSIPINITPSSPPPSRLTYSEIAASQYLMQNLHSEDVIFTDYRLAGPFTIHGFMRTVTALSDASENEPELSIGALEAIYYKDDADTAIAYINTNRIEDTPPNYLFFSRRATEVGIKEAMFGTFKPPSENYLEKFDKSPNINRLYDNGIGIVYKK